MEQTPRGFALILSIILTSVSLAIGLALLDVAYKQILISTTAKQSGIAFYNADSAMECALYYDQKVDAFNYGATSLSGGTCGGQPISVSYPGGASPHKMTFTVPCTPASSGISATVTIYKSFTTATTIFANGYNTCSITNPQRIERGLKITY